MSGPPIVSLVDYTRSPMADTNECGLHSWKVRQDGKDSWLCPEFICPLRDVMRWTPDDR